MKIIEILRLTEQGFSQRDIAKSAGCSKSTAGEIQKCCREVGISYEMAADLPYEELKKLVYPAATSQYIKQEPDFGTVYDASVAISK